MLGTANEQYLAAASRAHRCAGVTMYIRLPRPEDITAVHARHAGVGVVTGPLEKRHGARSCSTLRSRATGRRVVRSRATARWCRFFLTGQESIAAEA
jgi:hypothetical protein